MIKNIATNFGMKNVYIKHGAKFISTEILSL